MAIAAIGPTYTPLPDSWSFWADTIIGSVPLGPVTCTSFTATSTLSGFGSGAVTVPARSTALSGWLLNLWQWRLWAYYNGALVWCGVPSGVADDANSVVTLTLTEVVGYLTKRQFDVAGGKVYSQVEQTTIAADIAAPLTDAGVGLSVDAGPGFKRDRTYAYLEGQHRGELLTNLSQVISGPEFRTEYSVVGGRPRAVLKIAYPRVGSSTGLALSVPGLGSEYAGRWDSDNMRTRTFAVGTLPENAPEGAQQPVVVIDAPQTGVPRLDAADDWQDVQLVSTLTERAKTASAQYAAPVADITGSILVTTPAFGTYGPGDDLTVSVTNPMFPDAYQQAGRLTEMSVDAAAGTVALTATLNSPPPKARDTLASRLARLEASTTNQFRTSGAAPVSG